MRSGVILVAMLALVGLAALLPGNDLAGVRPERAKAAALLMGDVNCDAAVTPADIGAGLGAIAGNGTGACLQSSGDLNCSGDADAYDVLLLLRHFAGLPITAPAGCPAVGATIVEGPTSYELIDAARGRGEITQGQALLYHLYADLGEAALPAAYKGRENGPVESAVFHEIASAWTTLSPSEKAALQPYTLPPTAEGSWVEKQEGAGLAAVQWETVSNANVKVWWQTRRPEDAAKATAILAEMSAKIWPQLTTYMGRAPLSDAGYPNDGGDGRYDIYLVHNVSPDPKEKPVLGWAAPQDDASGNHKCEVTPTFMVLNSRSELTPVFYSTVAHEFMHSLQFTYDVGSCDDYRWLMESTAEWAESHFYPQVNAEHPWAPKYVEQLKTPLEFWEYKHPHQYGSYLFWYYLEHKKSLPNAVRAVWEASSATNSLAAVQAATAGAGGLKTTWAESALYNWNRAPYDFFSKFDSLGALPPYNNTEVSATKVPVTYPVPTAVGHMQQSHMSYTMTASVKTLTFLNPFAGSGEEFAKVQALVNINGNWEPVARDWTDKERVSFCFDKPEEKVKELVIIITNSDYLDRSHTFNVGDGSLVASPLGCKGWSGNATAELHYKGTGYDAVFTAVATDLRYTPQTDPPDEPGDRYTSYDLTEIGSLIWTVSGTWPGDSCVPSGTMSLDQPGTPNGAFGDIEIDTENNSYYIYAGGAVIGAMFTVTCEAGSFQLPWPSIQAIWNGGPTDTPLKVEGDHFVIDAEFTEPSPFYGGTWRWRFTETK
ncbi:hypothetical protein AYO38_00965 [bacterium SCGC AG-212-C10]|nr:hypothetical protein AYO38_00965 [bacterium SCGC AG-212-C10]